MKISKRAQAMPKSPIRKLAPAAKVAESKGLKVYHLNIGQPDINSPSSAIRALRDWDSPLLSYTHSEGTEEYRMALRDYYRARGIDISEQDIIATNGGSEALFFAFSAITDSGDEIIVPEPSYANYNGFANETDVRFIPVTSNIEQGYALPAVEEIELLVTEKTRAVLICNPGNPTGYVYTHKELEKLKEIALKHNLYIISDEVYREFVYDTNHTSILDFPELKENAIMIDSESKRFSMCGIRLGCVVSKNKNLMENILKYGQARLSPVITSQKIATVALKNSVKYLKECKEEYLKRRDFMVKRLNAMKGVVCPTPRGAFYCAVRFPVDSTEKFAKWLLEEFDYQGATLMIAPMEGFYFSKGKGTDEARLAYVLQIEDLEKALEVLEQGLKAYPGKK